MTTKQTKNEDGFFPDGYETPVNVSSFMKLEDGANLIRIVSNAVPGYEYWDVDNKPHRSKVKWETQPVNIRLTKEGKPTPIKHFWVFLVYNYKLEAVQSLELTQATVMKSIKALVDNPAWGNPTKYDLSIDKTGKDLATKYSVIPNPKTPLTPEITELVKNTDIDLEGIFDM